MTPPMRHHVPRVLRVALTLLATVFFFSGGPLIGLVLLPILRLSSRDHRAYRRRCTRVLGRLHAMFAGWLRRAGLMVGPEHVPALPGIRDGAPYLLVCNHPTFIDVVLLLGAYPDLTCLVNQKWYRTLALGALLRQSAYLPGPSRAGEGEDDVVGAMVEHLRCGHPLLVFPEGKRSLPAKLHRFRRGAVEAAVRAGVPIVALFLSTDRPFLTRGTPLWDVPPEAARYDLELLDVIDTSSVSAERARAINAELQAKYQARFAQLLEARAA